MIKNLANVLVAAGYGEVEMHMQRMESNFGKQLRRIAQTAAKVALVSREGTMSTDFEIVFIEHNRDFQPTSMENLYEGYGPSRGRVLCTTELGLQCFTNVGREGREELEHTIEKRIALKPKVVLDSVLHII